MYPKLDPFPCGCVDVPANPGQYCDTHRRRKCHSRRGAPRLTDSHEEADYCPPCWLARMRMRYRNAMATTAFLLDWFAED